MFHVIHCVKIRKYFLGNNYSEKIVIRENMFHVKHWIRIRKYFPGNNYG